MTPPDPAVLYEDNHLLIVSKPALIATMGVSPDTPSVVSWGKAYLKRKFNKPGNVYLGVVSRLDSFVSGVLPLARTSKAAARLTEAFAQRRVEKIYLAVVEGSPEPSDGVWTDWVLKDDRAHRMRRVDERTPGAKAATLAYRVLGHAAEGSLVAVRLETGRKHQIRVQFAEHGHPIVGDRKYGSPARPGLGIALHCAQVCLPHPTQNREVCVTDPPPSAWKSVWPRWDAQWQRLIDDRGRLAREWLPRGDSTL